MKNIFYLILIYSLLHGNKSHAGIATSSSGTYILKKNQYPPELAKNDPSCVIVIANGNYRRRFTYNDTVLDLKGFLDSSILRKYRVVYKQKNAPGDSVVEYDLHFRKTMDAVLYGNLLKITFFANKDIPEAFTLNYNKMADGNTGNINKTWFRRYELYTDYERSRYSLGKVWLLSVGIDNYSRNVKFANCVSDAQSFANYFEYQAKRHLSDSSIRKFVLINEHATKDSILHCLDHIIANAGANDYFIFNFSGITTFVDPENNDTINDQIYFRPYSTSISDSDIAFVQIKNSGIKKHLISLNSFDRKIQLIRADKQLFVVEAGPTENFKKEFLKGLTQDADRVLNANRVIMVPNHFGLDNVGRIQKGPINYFITSLDSATNIYDLFNEKEKNKVCYALKKTQYTTPVFNEDYFDIFYVRDYYKTLQNASRNNNTRGLYIPRDKSKLKKDRVSKRVALIIGTDNYNIGWNKLANPMSDARAIAEELEKQYGYEVKLMPDANMEAIYDTIRSLYRTLDTASQVLLYFAGHGYVDETIFADGFIVCHDSKPLTEDPNMSTYISFSKIRKMINKLPARQIIVITDICHGGAFDSNILGEMAISTSPKHKTRVLLASVGNEPAFDADKDKPEHSPFARFFLMELQRHSDDNTSFIATGIYVVLQKQSKDDTEARFNPHISTFGDHDPLSEFEFIPLPPAQPNIVKQ